MINYFDFLNRYDIQKILNFTIIMDKKTLAYQLKDLGAFWSYSKDSLFNISDDLLIEETLRWGDVGEIKAIFQLFSKDKVKVVWENYLVPDRSIYPHNYYLALIFFNIEEPNKYLESIIKKTNGRIRSFTP